MEIISKLITFAEKLDKSGHTVIARDVDTAASIFLKTAKELGGQGYWVRNERCWAGCYRKKRVASPDKAAQEVWMECLEEFQEAVKTDSDENWAKYAGKSDNIKTAEYRDNNDQLLASIDRENIASTVYSITNEAIQSSINNCVFAAESLSSISQKLASTDEKLSTEAAELSLEMIREAGLWDTMKGMWGAGVDKAKEVGNAIGNAAGAVGNAVGNKVRDFNARGAGSSIANAVQTAYNDLIKANGGWRTALDTARASIQQFTQSKNPQVVQRAQSATKVLQQIHGINIPFQNIGMAVEQLKSIMAGMDTGSSQPPMPSAPGPFGVGNAAGAPPAGGVGSAVGGAGALNLPNTTPTANPSPTTPPPANINSALQIMKNVPPAIQQQALDILKKLRSPQTTSSKEIYRLIQAQTTGLGGTPINKLRGRNRVIQPANPTPSQTPVAPGQTPQSAIAPTAPTAPTKPRRGRGSAKNAPVVNPPVSGVSQITPTAPPNAQVPDGSSILNKSTVPAAGPSQPQPSQSADLHKQIETELSTLPENIKEQWLKEIEPLISQYRTSSKNQIFRLL